MTTPDTFSSLPCFPALKGGREAREVEKPYLQGSTGKLQGSQGSDIAILVSSRDGIEPPPLPAANRLVEKARAAGWNVTITYAVADIPDRFFDNGNPAKVAHRVASVVLRLRRGSDRGWATWLAEDDKPWRFDHAYIALTRYGLRPGKTHAGILERINAA